MDFGIPEHDFWNMTLAELERLFDSKRRQRKQRLQEKAQMDYLLADLIGKSVARVYPKSKPLPDIEEAYAALFMDDKSMKEIEEEKQRRINELSEIRFRQFAESLNKRLYSKGGAKMNE